VPEHEPKGDSPLYAERLKRWRLVLGGDDAEGTGVRLGGEDRAIDGALDAVYGERGGDLSGSAPTVARWLGELRAHFPSGVVRVVQQDAIDRLGLHRLLLEPEVLESVTPDVHLAATLMSLRDALPEASRAVARRVVRQVVEDIERRLTARTRAAAKGALDRSSRTSRPKPNAIDWNRTIRANLRHYQPAHGTVIPERLIGHGRRQRSLAAELILCLDQSGSMAASVVHAGVLGASLASLPALQTRVIAFDTAVVDLTEELGDPVDVLFGIQLGGGTDIDQALGYCQTLVSHPAKTVLILLTDLYEGGDQDSMLRRAASLLRSGVRLIVLLALSDDGAPGYDHALAAEVAALGAPVFACTPDQFPDMLAAALEGRDVTAWAADEGITVTA
jgi:Mg-chelatase subunit ChlD